MLSDVIAHHEGDFRYVTHKGRKRSDFNLQEILLFWGNASKERRW